MSNAFAGYLRDANTQYFGWRIQYLSSHFFVDYDDESMLSYLSLFFGTLIGKKYKLEKQADIA